MDDMISISTNHLDTLRRCGGYYECPKDSQDHRLGPLVGYTDTYIVSDRREKVMVGDVYFNLAMAEEHPNVLRCFASSMQEKLESYLPNIDFFCGFPIGGYSFSQMLALIFKRQVIKAEKKVIVPAAALGVCEQYELVFYHHSVKEGKRYAIVKDICSNLAGTEKLISLIKSTGGIVTAIVCLLDRSIYYEGYYPLQSARGDLIPIVSLVKNPVPQYRQDDSRVLSDVQTGNVVWDPIGSWPQLMQVMQDNSR